MNAKSKALLSTTIGLLTTTSIVAPLATMTGCSSVNQLRDFEVDKEYGITQIVYEDLKNQFVTAYRDELILEHGEEWEHLDRYTSNLNKQLKSLDEVKNTKNNSFTSLTSALVQFAKTGKDLDGNPYNIRLDRKSNAQWSQLDTVFANWKDSFTTYMLNSDMTQSTINRVMKDAERKFNNLKNDLMKTCVDTLDGVLQGKELLITCFADVNDEIALVSAALQLNQMMNQYIFNTKDKDPGACLDNITDPEKPDYYREDFKVGNILSPKTMRQLFTITRKETDTVIDYTPTLIKGYTLQPKLTKIYYDKYKNHNTFKIDFGLVKTNYIGKYSGDKLASVTAHCYCADNWTELSSLPDDTPLTSFIPKLEIESIEYPINLTKEGEHKALRDAYFNKESELGYISFQWDNNADNQAYEAFFDNAKKDPKTGLWTGTLSSNSLINSCLMVSDNFDKNSYYQFIKDLFADSFSNNDELLSISTNTLVKKFIASCEISADVTINEINKDRKVVTINSFYVNYNNSIYKYDDMGKYKLSNTEDYSAYQTECVNHEVSKSFYEKVNEKFNGVLRFVENYDASVVNVSSKNQPITESGLDELEFDTNIQLFASITTFVSGIIAIGSTLFKIWKPWKSDGRTKAMNIVTCITLLVSLALQIIQFSIWMKKYYNPVKDFLDKYSNFKDQSPESELVRYLRKMLKEDYVLINEDGSYDKEEFDIKRQAFSKNFNMEEKLAEYITYSSIETSEKLGKPWKEYQDLLHQYHVEPEQLKEKISGWDAGGKYWMLSMLLSFIDIMFGIGLHYWIKHLPKQRTSTTIIVREDLTRVYDYELSDSDWNRERNDVNRRITAEWSLLAHKYLAKHWPNINGNPTSWAIQIWNEYFNLKKEQLYKDEKIPYMDQTEEQKIKDINKLRLEINRMNGIRVEGRATCWDEEYISEIIDVVKLRINYK